MTDGVFVGGIGTYVLQKIVLFYKKVSHISNINILIVSLKNQIFQQRLHNKIFIKKFISSYTYLFIIIKLKKAKFYYK